MTTLDVYQLPDLLAEWPWPRRINSHYASVKAQSSQWITSFQAFTPKAQVAFDRCDFSLLTALAFPNATAEQLRVACDMMQLFFVFDEYSDREEEGGVRAMADAIMAPMTTSTPKLLLPRGLLGAISQEFWERATSVLDGEFQRRFSASFQDYTDAVVQQAQDRDCALVRNIADYFTVRRHTIGTIPCFILLQLNLDLPVAITKHAILVQLETLATDMIILGNDLYSYNVEQSRGDADHNILTIVQKECDCSLELALRWLAEHHERLASSFLAVRQALPSFGPAYDAGVRRYIDGLGNWVRANEAWSFESQRYFGADGLDVQRHRRVVRLPIKIESSV